VPLKQVKVWTYICKSCKQWVLLDGVYAMGKTRADAAVWLEDCDADYGGTKEDRITDLCGCQRRKKT
jgi:hypothetical protein